MSLPALLSWISFSEVSGTLRAQTRISMFNLLNVSSVDSRRNLLVHQFRQVDGRHLSFHARDLDRIFDIHHAERTGGHDHVGARFGRHLHPLHAHALLFFRLVEQHQPAAAAAERAVAGALHLDSLQAGNGVEHIARIVVDWLCRPR